MTVECERAINPINSQKERAEDGEGKEIIGFLLIIAFLIG